MLGLCCQWLDESGNNTLKSRSLQLGRFNQNKYTPQKIQLTYELNVADLAAHLEKIYSSGISVLRMSSSMFPLFDKVPRHYWDNSNITDRLREIGEFVMDNSMRLTTHPGQFVVLSSPKQNVQDNALRELEFHSWLFDIMGLPATPYYSINIHGGGKPDRIEPLRKGIKRLSQNAKRRLTLENCEFGWSVVDLAKVGVPVCFDSHHHTFNTGGISSHAAMMVAIMTWPKDVKPLTHISNVKEGVATDAPATKRRAHSDYIYEFPPHQLRLNNEGRIDVDIEAKKKNLAIFDLVDKFEVVL